jgi:predicted ATP-grasp superfamily ATP-dependent carboligase
VFIGPEGEINLIGVFDELLDLSVEAQKLGKFAPDFEERKACHR